MNYIFLKVKINFDNYLKVCRGRLSCYLVISSVLSTNQHKRELVQTCCGLFEILGGYERAVGLKLMFGWALKYIQY